eukprot:668089-Prymnesium_polylepis.2
MFGASFGGDMAVLLELVLGDEPDFDCLSANAELGIAAPGFLLAFLLLVGVLLMNMLIVRAPRPDSIAKGTKCAREGEALGASPPLRHAQRRRIG